MTSVAYPRGTKEYVKAVIGPASVTLDMPVELALARGGEEKVWLPATWIGDVGTTRTAQTVTPIEFDDTYPHAAYTLYANLVDTPEEPVILVGTVYILGSTDAEPVPTGDVIDGGTF